MRMSSFTLLVVLAVSSWPPGLRAQPFVRGDVDTRVGVNISDPVRVLRFLLRAAGGDVGCEDAVDANDDGALDLAKFPSSAVFAIVFADRGVGQQRSGGIWLVPARGSAGGPGLRRSVGGNAKRCHVPR